MTNEQAIAMISHIKDYIVDNQGDKEYGGALDMAIEALESNVDMIPLAFHDKVCDRIYKRYTDLVEKTRWIPVTERLPDEEVASVLIYTSDGGVAEGQYYPTIKSWKQFRWSVENANVTHWMPLPEPPTE